MREWNFHSRSQKLGMEFSRSRSQKLGMKFFIPVPVPKVWEWAEPFPFPFPNDQKSFPLTPTGGAPPPDPVSLIDFDPLLRVPPAPAPAPVAPWGMPSSPPGEEPSPHPPTVNSTIARLTPCIICTASVYSHNEILAKLGKQYCRPRGDALICHRVHPSIAL